jgi:hypothetical protein
MNARGVKELAKYEVGEKLTLKQSVLAKCAECCCKYADGKVDCGISECPLYPFMVYGGVYRSRGKKILSPIQRKSLQFSRERRQIQRQSQG